MSDAAKRDQIEVDVAGLYRALERIRHAIPQVDYKTLADGVYALEQLVLEIQKQKVVNQRLTRVAFGSGSERTTDVLGPSTPTDSEEAPGEGEDRTNETSGTDGTGSTDNEDNEDNEQSRTDEGSEQSRTDENNEPSRANEGSKRKKSKGHGRNGEEAYQGAETIDVAHEGLKAGDGCPVENCNGRLYAQKRPRILIRLRGEAPVQAKRYRLERLRCGLCGKVFTATPPEGVGDKKYDATSAAMVALLKYGSGLPFNRLERLEGNLGIPLPAATQWDVVQELARVLEPVYEELIRQAAQGEVLHNDDTGARILELMGKRRAEREVEEGKPFERTGIFTSGIVSIACGQRIALYFTGRKHAGENLGEVLERRASELSAPIQMCDALSRNLPGDFEVILTNCMAHARRPFVDVAANFPAACRFVLETLREIYKNDEMTRARGMSPEERMEFHQKWSAPQLETLHEWLEEQLEKRLVEPNSGLGQAISYMLKHWKKLTRFLWVPGAPIDNNLVERALKKAILHRKSSLFYKTQNGARVGDLLMSLIHTCELAGGNPFDYLSELQRHPEELREHPADWLPWNYRTTLECLPAAVS